MLALGMLFSILILGFALGYGVRAAISYHRRERIRRQMTV
jgi:hypothetical protein